MATSRADRPTSIGGGEALRTRLERLLASGDERLSRLSVADTSITLLNLDAPEQSVTLLLDRRPPIVVGGDDPAEITVELSDEQAGLFARGRLQLPSALLTGSAGYRGPVRKYLGVDPILRRLLSDLELVVADEAEQADDSP